LTKVVKAASDGTSQVLGPYAAERAEAISNELRQAGATVEIEAPKSAASVEGPAPPNDLTLESPITKIKQLAELRDAGIVTPEEFEAKKAELLSQV
jgi:hypothetical protein